MTRHQLRPFLTPLRSTLAYVEREASRRAKGIHPGMMRLADDELAALLELLRQEVRPAAEQSVDAESKGSALAEEAAR